MRRGRRARGGATITAVRRASILLIVVALGCGHGGSRVTASGKVPYPTDFTPPPPLPDPPRPDPNVRGHDYLVAVYDGIREVWHQFLEDCRLRLPPTHPLNKPDLLATVDVSIDLKGGMHDLRITGSGNDEFDTAVRDLMRDRAPYPTPPADLLSDDGKLHLRWRFARDQRQAGIATAEVNVIVWGIDRAVPKLLADGKVRAAAMRLARAPADAAGRTELAEQVFGAVITQALDGNDVAARRLAADIAARTPIPGAAASLRARARTAVDPGVRVSTFGALAALGDPETATLAVEALREGPAAGAPVVAAAAVALERVGAADRIKPVLTLWLRAAATEESARAATLAVLAAVPAGDLLKDVSKVVAKREPRTRAAACAVYGRAAGAGSAAAWGLLNTGIADADASVRAACALAAGSIATKSPDKRTIAALVARLVDPDLTVRAAAIVALAKLDRVRAARELKSFVGDADSVVLAALADAWGRLPKPPADRLRKLTRHVDAEVRVAAINSLVRLGDPASLSEAALHAGDASEAVRLAALHAVRAEEVLRELTRDQSPAVRGAADEALVALLGRAKTLTSRLEAVAADDDAASRVRLAASWLLAR